MMRSFIFTTCMCVQGGEALRTALFARTADEYRAPIVKIDWDHQKMLASMALLDRTAGEMLVYSTPLVEIMAMNEACQRAFGRETPTHKLSEEELIRQTESCMVQWIQDCHRNRTTGLHKVARDPFVAIGLRPVVTKYAHALEMFLDETIKAEAKKWIRQDPIKLDPSLLIDVEDTFAQLPFNDFVALVTTMGTENLIKVVWTADTRQSSLSDTKASKEAPCFSMKVYDPFDKQVIDIPNMEYRILARRVGPFNYGPDFAKDMQWFIDKFAQNHSSVAHFLASKFKADGFKIVDSPTKHKVILEQNSSAPQP